MVLRDGISKGCAKGKNVRNPFPSSDSKTKGILEMIHSYACGPMPTTSLNGYAYYITFVDDYSRKTWITFLRVKMKYSANSRSTVGGSIVDFSIMSTTHLLSASVGRLDKSGRVSQPS